MKLISWVAAGSVAGWGAARLAGADQIRRLEAPAAPLMSFTPHVTAAALLGSVLLRRPGAATTAGLTGAALAAVVLPRAIRRPQPQATGPVLRVLTANLLVGRAAEESVVGLVRQQAADVLFLQELTDAAPRGPRGGGSGRRRPAARLPSLRRRPRPATRSASCPPLIGPRSA